ncbi:Rossmann-like and DUF2520 domain-containing protein [Acetivibrio clariflavus]|uniref:Rossmann-like and DUF2520 domain-containing protein n=1 Tax=Acetivibrio clariflavus TaxID=288965 RepID=UPI00211F3196|nr:Rossmann-like and DUF2520 domain-containing protein [Acetivibrio clariflavus]
MREVSAMNVGIIGAGRLGSAFAVALNKIGACVGGIYSRSEESSRLLCRKVGIETENSMEAAVRNSDAILLAVSDNHIGNVAAEIASCINKKYIEGKIFLHLSGALTSEILKPLEDLGAFTGSFHPIQTFADRDNGWKKLFNCFFGFEGCIEAKKYAEAIVEKLEGKLILIEKEQKNLYHAAACIISNYTVTLFHIMHQLLVKAGMDENTAADAFLPLLKNTVDNIEKLGYINALTGPISRGDHKVIEKHIDSLLKEIPEYEAIYRMLGKYTLDVADKRGSISNEDKKKLIELLET